MKLGLKVSLAALLWVVVGCDEPVATPRPVVLLRPVELADGLTLSRPPGFTAPVAELVWGGPSSARRLGVRFLDGRFAIYWPDRDIEPISVSPPGIQVDALMINAGGMPLTGDGHGLSFWEISDGPARNVGFKPIGPVTALSVGHDADGPILAAKGDGSIERYVVIDRDKVIGPTTSVKIGTIVDPVVGLVVNNADRGWFATNRSGRTLKLGSDLSVPQETVTKVDPKGLRISRANDSSLVLEAKRQGVVDRLAIPGTAISFDWVHSGAELVVSLPSRLLIIPGGAKLKQPSHWRELSMRSPLVSVDPADPESRRLAVADANGRMEVLDAEGLLKRASRFSLIDAADAVLKPWKWAYRPREESDDEGESEFPESLAKLLREARDKVGADASADLVGLIRSLETHPALNRHSAAEVATLRALVEMKAGRSPESVFKTLEQARNGLELLGLKNRATDIRLWQAYLLCPKPELGRDGDPKKAREILEDMLENSNLTENSIQNLLAQAFLAGIDLHQHKVRDADERLTAILPQAESIPAVFESPDWLNLRAECAFARRDWNEAIQLNSKVLARIHSQDVPELVRAVKFRQATAFAHLGEWEPAAEVLQENRSLDSEWSLAQATIRTRAGLSDTPSDDHYVEGRRLATGVNRALAVNPLKRAVETLRRGGHVEQAFMAELELAETYESIDKKAEAAQLYRSAIKSQDSAVSARAERGVIRYEISQKRVDRALAVMTHQPDDHPGIQPGEFHLDVHEAILVYQLTGPESITGILIRGNEPHEARRVAVGRTELDRVVRAWRGRLGDNGRGLAPLMKTDEELPLGPIAAEPDLKLNGNPPSQFRSWEWFLEDALITPFSAGLIGVSKLTLVLDDSLAAMPVEVIGRDRRLYRRFDLTRSPSLAQLLRKPPITEPGMVVSITNGASPIPWAGPAEIAHWQESAGTSGFRVERNPTEESSLFALIAAKAILDPREGRWGMAQVETNPIWTGDQGRGPGMKVRVAILAVGDPENRGSVAGEGLQELATGVLRGGAAAVILTLWDPPAESGRMFFDLLQEGLIRGQRPLAALDRARDKIARNPRFADPVHWAGYVLYGRP